MEFFIPASLMAIGFLICFVHSYSCIDIQEEKDEGYFSNSIYYIGGAIEIIGFIIYIINLLIKLYD